MIERAQRLYERYFTDSLAEEAALEAQQHEQLIGAIADWLGRPYMAEFRKFLEEIRKGCEPRPGEERDMLYAIGRRDGLDLVIQRLDYLEREVRQG